MKYLSLLFLLLLISSASATNVTTLPATSVDEDSATLGLNLSNLSTGSNINTWFEYGMSSSFYKYRTSKENRTANGTYSVTIDSFPLMAGKTFYYRGMATDIEGNQSSFTLSTITTIADNNFDRNYQELKDANFNVTKTVTVLPKTYEDIIGTAFWGAFFGLIFVAMWIRQDDVTIPSILGIIISAGIFSLVPDDYLKIGYALLIVSIAGIVVSIVFKK